MQKRINQWKYLNNKIDSLSTLSIAVFFSSISHKLNTIFIDCMNNVMFMLKWNKKERNELWKDKKKTCSVG